MELVCGQMNKVTLDFVHQRCISKCSQVLMAIAYADGKNMQVFEDCKTRGLDLEFYGRHDYSVPIHPSVLKWFIDASSPGLSCSLVHEYYHPKVIWWVGVGAYIGSANLTPRAWDRNIEAGVFLSEAELTDSDVGPDLLDFFSHLKSISTPLSREIWLDQHAQLEFLRQSMNAPEKAARDRFEQRNRVPLTTFPWLASSTKSPFQRFEEEWNSTLELLRMIGKRVSQPDVKPAWVRYDVPECVQGDQFLHAFYYKNARQITRVRELHEKNKLDRERALREAMEDWRQTSATEAADEVEHMHTWAPLVADLCRKDKILTLSVDELAQLLQHIHAARDHVSHGPLDFMPEDASQWTTDERISSLAEFLWNERSKCGWSVLQMLHYVVWGADGLDAEPITKRLWRASHQDAQLPHLGISTLGELVGWARSDRYPPRNGRTSKALLALGNNVTLKLT